MWTINDFLAYRIVYGWSTHVKLAFPYCMKNNKEFTLTNGGKLFFFTTTGDSCQRIIILERIKSSLLVELKWMLHRHSFLVEELYGVVSEYGDIVFSFQFNKHKFPDFGLIHNWVKQIIF